MSGSGCSTVPATKTGPQLTMRPDTPAPTPSTDSPGWSGRRGAVSMNHMTNDPPDGDSLRPSSAAAGPADRRYRPRAMLRAVDAKTRPDLKRAIPVALLTLASFQFGEGLGGIRRTTPAFFNVFGGTFEVPTPYVKRRRRAALRNGSGSPSGPTVAHRSR